MGFKTQLLAVGPERPRLALARNGEGGPMRAAEAVARYLPELFVVPIGTRDMAHGGYPLTEEEIWVSTFGPTVVFGGEVLGQLGAQISRSARHENAGTGSAEPGRWELTIHSVVDLCTFEIDEPGGLSRSLTVTSEHSREDVDGFATGDPLPFEVPYWNGEHTGSADGADDGAEHDELPFHPLELGEAALAWIFGLSGEGAPADAVQESLDPIVGVDDVPMHGFRLAATPEPPKTWWARLFRR